MLQYDPHSKRLGSYLIDAGLLTEAQVDVALADQQQTVGMKLGEIVVMRGWVSPKTMEFVIQKVVNIERGLGEPLNQKFLESQKYRLKQKN
jgi:hypothetical protein